MKHAKLSKEAHQQLKIFQYKNELKSISEAIIFLLEENEKRRII